MERVPVDAEDDVCVWEQRVGQLEGLHVRVLCARHCCARRRRVEERELQRAIVSHDGESSCESSDSYARAVPFRPFTCAHHAV